MSSTRAQLSKEERATEEILARLARAADEFEDYAHPHAERVARIADELAKLFGLGGADRSSLRLAALGHDLGELAMQREYLRRAGPLSEDERLDLARHPVIGEQEVARAGAGQGVQLLVRWHHEWWNGTGYPDALRREQIPLAARILRAADAYAALTDARPFRPALTEEEARRRLTEWTGIEFDPQVVRALLSLQGIAELRSFARPAEPPSLPMEEPFMSATTAAVRWNGDAGQSAAIMGETLPPAEEGTNHLPTLEQLPDASAPQPAPVEEVASNISDTTNHA